MESVDQGNGAVENRRQRKARDGEAG
jgi:ribosome-associated protein YbcJ (S4-like RNA binding protein)